MRNIATLVGRELRSYYFSPLAYIIIAFFLAMCGFFFSFHLSQSMEATLRPVLDPVAFITMIIAPLISMRLIAEERKMGTLELLLTAPTTTGEVVTAKFLGAWFFYISLLLPTLCYLGIFAYYGGNWAFAPTLTFYLGLVLLGGAYLSVGMLISSFTTNQIVASFVTFIILFLVYMLFLVERNLPQSWLSHFATYASWFTHLDSFKKGILNTEDLLYFFMIIVFFNFLTVAILDSRRESSAF